MRDISFTAFLTLAAFFLGFRLVYENLPDPSEDYTWSQPEAPISTTGRGDRIFLNPYAPEQSSGVASESDPLDPRYLQSTPPITEDTLTVASLPDSAMTTTESGTDETETKDDSDKDTSSKKASGKKKSTAKPLPETPVVVYTTRSLEYTRSAFTGFTNRTGISVDVIEGAPAGFNAYMQQAKTNKNVQHPDVFIAGHVAPLAGAAKDGLLTPMRSKDAKKNIPKYLRDPDYKWYGLSKRSVAVFRHKEDKKAADIVGFNDLTKKKFRNKVLSSPDTARVVAAALAHKKNTAKATAFLAGVSKNFSSDTGFSGSNQSDAARLREAASGKGKVAIAYINAYIRLYHSGYAKDRATADALDVIFSSKASGGAPVNITGIGVVTGTPNPGAAKALLDYLVSAEGQRVYAYANFEYPAAPRAPLFSELISLGSIPENVSALRTLPVGMQQLNAALKKTP